MIPLPSSFCFSFLLKPLWILSIFVFHQFCRDMIFRTVRVIFQFSYSNRTATSVRFDSWGFGLPRYLFGLFSSQCRDRSRELSAVTHQHKLQSTKEYLYVHLLETKVNNISSFFFSALLYS